MQQQQRRAWIIAISLFISLFFLWGGGYNTSPIFLAALLKAFGWSHTRVAWIIGGLSLAVGISAPAAGWLLDRLEARLVMGTGAILAVVGLLSASRSHTFAGLLLSVVVLGIGLGASTWVAASLVIANWFPEHRGMALGIVTAGMESGGMVMTYVVGRMIAAHGWRMGYFTVAVPSLLLVLPLLWIAVRTRPPSAETESAAARSASRTTETLMGLEVADALKTRAFWMLAIAQLSFGLGVGGTFFHVVAYLEGLRYGLATATLVVSIVLGMAAIGKAAMGTLGDFIGGKNALTIGFIIITASVVILLHAQWSVMLVLWVLLLGIAGASPVVLVPLVVTETLGLKCFGLLFGWLTFVLTLGLSGGPLLVGWITDMTHSYVAGFELCGLICLTGAVVSFLCVAPRPIPIPAVGQSRASTSSPA